MTDFERKQNHSIFVSAGRTAFLIGVHMLDNPYRLEPYRDLWNRGYRAALRNHKEREFKTRQKERTDTPRTGFRKPHREAARHEK